MKLKTIALALAVAAGGITAGQAFAQDRDVTITRDTPNGTVTKHIVRSGDDGSGQVVRRTTRVVRPDGSTVVRRTTRVTHRVYSQGYVEPTRVAVIHHRYDPDRHVVVRRYEDRQGWGERRYEDRPYGERHVTVVHEDR